MDAFIELMFSPAVVRDMLTVLAGGALLFFCLLPLILLYAFITATNDETDKPPPR
jgi:hypothetical protein